MAISQGGAIQQADNTTGYLQSKEREGVTGGALEDGNLVEQAWERKESGVDDKKEELIKPVA